MKALVFKDLNIPLAYEDLPVPQGGKGYAVVKLHASAVNHRDVFITKGLYSRIKLPCILGSDGAGEYNGKPVVLYPAFDWGGDQAFQGPDFRVLGMPDDGTFAEYIKIPRANIHRMPDHLQWEEAAALPLAGLTAWRTLFSRCNLRAGEKVLISGIGGGVALIAMQFAVAAGAEVFVTSGSDEKIERACAMGAKDGANYKKEDWDRNLKKAVGGFDVIVDSAAGDGFAAMPGLCNPGARVGVYGGTLGKVNGLSLQPVFWKQVSILGSSMGSPIEFKSMLGFVQKHEIVPAVDAVFSLEQGNEAFEKMDKGGQFGKIVLRHPEN